ncbi:50S ribosomal protein L10 [Mycoplasma capricolum subsp. capripneumoniae]|uniref:Large ribosomal subunit protein uL10 n=5 Tax=Mycoplasma capricolum TaxID=2095 RepID=RL10_MYCCT|nr:50S ribosomal protein L10 [Mycoplasma capricolum]Q2ST51.1 RecName: Full=Large ribosomal subunit protein uL10; AltName: Full=50S ribosomal protein L10 [Mycoplasma capricolum subsp. capricolum ATCC 27343]ABC01175.1 50S ribosomal protein L10 [Mycoplasma capricolum subsp. capricolum ATCC 27343]AJK51087.1 50S ribosomal protein L10 [Mycoplasma capricolum subsp. capripneumoniae 87001]AQU77268.1 50S ribosomal protein L10 [Mycoplasma capricolum subsp. capripneumoniae]KEY84346.1 50S ribosomal protein
MSNSRPAHARKAEIVAEIVSKIKSAQGVAIAEYKHLTVAKMTELRVQALKQNIDIKVYKDSLVRRAVEELGLVDLIPFLTQQNVFIFSNEDSISAAKLVANFAKKNEALKLKAGIYEGKVVDTAGINEVASLPSKEELYSMFASSLLYPLRKVMAAINAVAETRN